MALTNRSIAAAREGATLWDDSVTGLHLRVRKSGKAFFFYYRTKDGLERRPKIGDLGILTLDQARRVARDMAAAVAMGRDPMAERNIARNEPTVTELCEKYMKEHGSKKKSAKEDRRLIDKYIKPVLGNHRVKNVQYGDITALRDKYAATPFQANRVLSLLSKMFNLAEYWQFRPAYSNPCRHVDRFPEPKRKVYVKADEAPRIAAVLRKYEGSRPGAVLFVYLLILSGARPDEIRRARPDMVEPRPIGGVLRLKEHKTDGTTGEERIIYLPPQVMALLEKAPSTKDSLTGVKYPDDLWERVRKEADVPHLRLYDLRHTFASAALKAGHTLDQIGELLGHKDTRTTKRYAHIIDDLAQQAAAETATVLEQMLRGPAPAESRKAEQSE